MTPLSLIAEAAIERGKAAVWIKRLWFSPIAFEALAYALVSQRKVVIVVASVIALLAWLGAYLWERPHEDEVLEWLRDRKD